MEMTDDGWGIQGDFIPRSGLRGGVCIRNSSQWDLGEAVDIWVIVYGSATTLAAVFVSAPEKDHSADEAEKKIDEPYTQYASRYYGFYPDAFFDLVEDTHDNFRDFVGRLVAWVGEETVGCACTVVDAAVSTL